MPVTVSSARLRRRSGGRRLAKCSRQRAKASATKRFSRRRFSRRRFSRRRFSRATAVAAKQVCRRRGRRWGGQPTWIYYYNNDPKIFNADISQKIEDAFQQHILNKDSRLLQLLHFKGNLETGDLSIPVTRDSPSKRGYHINFKDRDIKNDLSGDVVSYIERLE